MNAKFDVTQVLESLTLEEKVSLCSGNDFFSLIAIERFNIPSIEIADGPHGLRKQRDATGFVLTGNVPSTCFPTASALASTWNTDLIYDVAHAIGEEAHAEQVGVVLGPGANIKRSPLCGRNFEYFSEDPFLSGSLATAYIQGIQSTGIGCSLKHLAVNNQETRRLIINALVDERALREIYLAGFEQAVKTAQPRMVMAAYNRLNGEFCSEDPYLLNSILRDEWGFDGVVVSDWGAVNNRVAGIAAGLDLEMPGLKGAHDKRIIQALEQEKVSMNTVDQSAKRILELISIASDALSETTTYDTDEHHELACKAASEAAVLLKNENNVLPLTAGTDIAIIGAFAKFPHYQGAGSSRITPSKVDIAYEQIVQAVGHSIPYAAGYDMNSDAINLTLIEEAKTIAKNANTVVIFAGLPEYYEIEQFDRLHIDLPEDHNMLIEAVAEVNKNIVVILMNGAPVTMPWIDKVSAVFEVYLGGQGGGTAIARLLSGEVNPSGKLAETFPLHLEDHPAHQYFPGGKDVVEYRESIYVGYRYYDTANVDVLFPFGHGLSYTSFEYSNLTLSHDSMSDDDTLDVSLDVSNTGDYAGKEVIQLYVRDIESTIFRPQQELKAFTKIHLLPNETKTISFKLDKRAFAYWDINHHDWLVESGVFEIRVGSSSRDIRISQSVTITTTSDYTPDVSNQEQLQNYYDLSLNTFDYDAFAALFENELPVDRPVKRGQYTTNTAIGDMNGSFVARQLRNFMLSEAKKRIKDDHELMANRELTLLDEIPLRLLSLLTDGAISLNQIDALVHLTNGHYWTGIRMFLAERRKKRESSLKENQ